VEEEVGVSHCARGKRSAGVASAGNVGRPGWVCIPVPSTIQDQTPDEPLSHWRQQIPIRLRSIPRWRTRGAFSYKSPTH